MFSMVVSDLKILLKSMKPELAQEKYFVASVPESQLMNLAEYMQHILQRFYLSFDTFDR